MAEHDKPVSWTAAKDIPLTACGRYAYICIKLKPEESNTRNGSLKEDPREESFDRIRHLQKHECGTFNPEQDIREALQISSSWIVFQK